jgi:hypothetical protein
MEAVTVQPDQDARRAPNLDFVHTVSRPSRRGYILTLGGCPRTTHDLTKQLIDSLPEGDRNVFD